MPQDQVTPQLGTTHDSLQATLCLCLNKLAFALRKVFYALRSLHSLLLAFK